MDIYFKFEECLRLAESECFECFQNFLAVWGARARASLEVPGQVWGARASPGVPGPLGCQGKSGVPGSVWGAKAITDVPKRV